MGDHDNVKSDPGTPIDSVTRSAEDIALDEKEAGRTDTGTQGSTERPTGTSTTRDLTSIDPKEPMDGGSPTG